MSVDRQGFFTCTARLDGQTLLVVGAINTKGGWRFATGSLLLVPKRLIGAVERGYERQSGMKGTAACGSHSVIVTQASVECEVKGASGEVVTATAALNPDADLTGITFSDASGG